MKGSKQTISDYVGVVSREHINNEAKKLGLHIPEGEEAADYVFLPSVLKQMFKMDADIDEKRKQDINRLRIDFMAFHEKKTRQDMLSVILDKYEASKSKMNDELYGEDMSTLNQLMDIIDKQKDIIRTYRRTINTLGDALNSVNEDANIPFPED